MLKETLQVFFCVVYALVAAALLLTSAAMELSYRPILGRPWSVLVALLQALIGVALISFGVVFASHL